MTPDLACPQGRVQVWILEGVPIRKAMTCCTQPIRWPGISQGRAVATSDAGFQVDGKEDVWSNLGRYIWLCVLRATDSD